MSIGIIVKIWLFVLGLLPSLMWANTFKVQEVNYLSINSAITPATLDYLKYELGRMNANSFAVIKINTPGGLVTTTKDIITLMGKQPYPIAVWIAPEGASASSAGAIIASAAHLLFMSPGSNIGAATPIGMGGDLKESDGRSKAINDLASLVRSLSHLRGRPSAPFEQMIKTAASFTDKEALKAGIIDGIVGNTDELLKLSNGKKFKLQGKEFTLEIKENPGSRDITPSAGQKIFEVIANPSTAYVLFLVGLALLYFELQVPGGYVAGSIGVGCLILAAMAFQVLPMDWGALGLILLGVFFFVLEIWITSYGLLSIAGSVAFIMGSLFLFHGDTGFISIDYPVIYSTLAGVFAAVGIVVWYLYRDQKRQKPVADFFVPVGAEGQVLTKSPNGYQIKVKGEIWRAEATTALDLGDHVEVTAVDIDQLLVHVKKVSR